MYKMISYHVKNQSTTKQNLLITETITINLSQTQLIYRIKNQKLLINKTKANKLKKMSKQQLTELLIKGDKPYKYGDEVWFRRYNDVVDVYNSSVEATRRLQQMKCPYKSYLAVSYLINNYLFNITMVLCFTFLPLFNLILQVLLISYTVFLKKQTSKHDANLLITQDPFENFYYYPEMCQQLEKHFTTLNLTVEEVENFKFNDTCERLRQNLLRSDGEGERKKGKVKVPIYDQYFYDSFFLVRKQYFKAISWSILGMILIAFSVLFYSAVYQDLTE